MANDILSYDEFLEYCVTNGYTGDLDSIRESYNDYLNDAAGNSGVQYEDLLEFFAQNGVSLDSDQLENLREAYSSPELPGEISGVPAVSYNFTKKGNKLSKAARAALKAVKSHPKTAAAVGAAAGAGAAAAAIARHKKKASAKNESVTTYEDFLEYCTENGIMLTPSDIQIVKEEFFF